MKKLILLTAITVISAMAVFAQTKGEQEILKFISDYDQSFLNKDITFAERVLAENYIFSGNDGAIENRSKALEEMRKELAKPTYKTVSMKSVNDSMHITGNIAVASGSWMWSGLSTNNLQGEPHVDKGRYTMVLEKMGGKWMVIAEHNSEAQHDRKLMEQQIIKAGHDYEAAMKSRDRTAYERLLHADYIFTNEDGKIVTRAEDIAHAGSSDTVLTSLEGTDQKIQILGNSSAVETGMYHAIGTNKGKPFDETGRYTTSWVWRDFRWQIIADHTSLVKK